MPASRRSPPARPPQGAPENRRTHFERRRGGSSYRTRTRGGWREGNPAARAGIIKTREPAAPCRAHRSTRNGDNRPLSEAGASSANRRDDRRRQGDNDPADPMRPGATGRHWRSVAPPRRSARGRPSVNSLARLQIDVRAGASAPIGRGADCGREPGIAGSPLRWSPRKGARYR